LIICWRDGGVSVIDPRRFRRSIGIAVQGNPYRHSLIPVQPAEMRTIGVLFAAVRSVGFSIEEQGGYVPPQRWPRNASGMFEPRTSV
jgi:hypothetical protein